MLKKIAVALILITWPLSLFLANTPKDFLHYLLPFLEPKFAIFPLLFVLIYFKFKKLVLLLISITLLLLFFKPFFGQTVFIKDYEAQQQILQKTFLYDSIFIARVFQNKPRIISDKLTDNFFALTDPNNYFFGFAPRQITIDNQNLKKFPFLSLPFLFIGLYYLTKQKAGREAKHTKLLIAFLLAAIINLTLLTNFDRNDFILYIPLSLIILSGLTIFDAKFKSQANYFYLFFIAFSTIQILRLFIK